MWVPIKKFNGKSVNTLLTTEQKEAWEAHAATRNIYRFEYIEEPERPKIEPPIEAKSFVRVVEPKESTNPKKPESEAVEVNESELVPNQFDEFHVKKRRKKSKVENG